MTTYVLEKQAIDIPDKVFYAHLSQMEPLESVLIISDTYYIERRVSKKGQFLFYVHVENGGLKKVCVYKKEAKKSEKEEGLNG